MELLAYQVNAFTKDASGGNPAGVVLNADDLSAEHMQAIAHSLGFSETAFVSKDDECDFQLRFFTPNSEVDFCGHATVATFFLMFQQQMISAKSYRQRTKAGKLAVTVFPDGLVELQQLLPQFLGQLPAEEIAASLNIPVAILSSTNLAIEKVSTGLTDIIIALPPGYLDKVSPDLQVIAALSNQHQATGYHLFELAPKASPLTAYCRNFAPAFGINEESATGSACGALACYLFKHQLTDSTEYLFEQGRIMNCTSTIKAKIASEGRKIRQVCVAGHAQLIKTHDLTI